MPQSIKLVLLAVNTHTVTQCIIHTQLHIIIHVYLCIIIYTMYIVHTEAKGDMSNNYGMISEKCKHMRKSSVISPDI